tara:strand:+ start:4411 stop:4659 length:249 start_codon:yes stop_codon:yes gene_type:complete
MTITTQSDARRLLVDDKIVRAYSYTNLMNGLQMFAMFEDPKHDDTDVSPFVVGRRLLKDGKKYTDEGLRFYFANEPRSIEFD